MALGWQTDEDQISKGIHKIATYVLIICANNKQYMEM